MEYRVNYEPAFKEVSDVSEVVLYTGKYPIVGWSLTATDTADWVVWASIDGENWWRVMGRSGYRNYRRSGIYWSFPFIKITADYNFSGIISANP